MDEYKKLMVLHYLNNVRASYSYNELLMLFGFQNEQLDLMLEELINEELIKLDQYFQLTKKGINELDQLNLLDVDYESIDDEELFTEIPIGFAEIYVPEEFSGKFKSFKI